MADFGEVVLVFVAVLATALLLGVLLAGVR
jgi:hypothetical protein